ncbi:hypothetical protein [Nocardia sp. NPDC052566]|uniref:hypothetical protein n=1 Tax=Nocardia sp. NPDC052566 TaxID=3364330 RepID=UPI0037C8DC2A
MGSIALRPSGTVARFVAYDRRIERIGNPEDGTAIQVRAETFVEEYVSIKVCKYTEKSSNGFDTIYVTFDAASAGNGKMEYDFGASTEPGTEVAARLKTAFETRTPVYVAVETCRRKTQEGTKTSINVLTPIHTLRGATDVDAKADPQATKANCIKVVAAVGSADDPADTVYAAKDLRSEPTEWVQLRGNRRGDLAPEGWRCLMRDGHPVGGITNHVPAHSTDTAEIVQAVGSLLESAGVIPAAASGGGSVTVRRARASEARPWEPQNSDGRVNPGGWLAAKYREAHQEAISLFDAVIIAAGDDGATLADVQAQHIWELTDLLLLIADNIQTRVLGLEQPDRAAGSHREALQWAIQTARTRHHYTSEHITSQEARLVWARAVWARGVENYSAALQRINEYLGIDTKSRPDAAPARQPSQQPERSGAAARHHQPPGVDQKAVAALRNQPSAPRQAITAGNDETAIRMWNDLADAIGMAGHMDDLRPVLIDTFGGRTGELGEIDAVAFKRQVATWRKDPGAFFAIAEKAFNMAKAS